MHILISDHARGSVRTLQCNRWQLGGALALLVVVLMALSGSIYHFIFLTAVRDNWPVVSQVVRWVIRDESAQRDRLMRENLDAMATRLGELQARVVRMEAMEERVLGLAGFKGEEVRTLRQSISATPSVLPAASAVPGAGGAARAGQGGLLVEPPGVDFRLMEQELASTHLQLDRQGDLLALAESRLFESRLLALAVPSSRPVEVEPGSGFGIRFDPFTGRPALHTGLDFAAPPGTPVRAAAGGVVSLVDSHPQYGRMVEVDHGQGLLTRYAHLQSQAVQPGDLVKRGQVIGAVGNSGRSTGPHLHFEVLVEGVPQNPSRFLAATAPSRAAELLTRQKPGRASRP
ncbi:M23 family metallopeptidase [Ideonella livida]|uniref:Peptidoglycan DD-metalloendopeptidase family protein n=1 Tax=Ideonella livida TaxID=2707176 RepID=A0A7C9TJG9_9BURK|nr:M23 family metallopeptidase [Ideonella livida]NDY89646.1 peptidoglycan DD-metalloendopeptidase family protein [Ideonella livida]